MAAIRIEPTEGKLGGVIARLAVLLLAAAAVPLLAHDFWIEPGSFRPRLERPLPLTLKVGDHFRGQLLPRRASHLESFRVVSPSGKSVDALGLEGRSPAGYFRPEEAGLHVAVYRSRHTTLSLAPDKFRAYLEEEGLHYFLPALEARESDDPVREAFSRCAKSLLLVRGPGEEAGTDRALGLPLELVAQANPYALAEGGELPVLVLLASEPAEGTLVTALRASSDERIEQRADAGGRVRLELGPGTWLVKAVHIAPAGAGVDAEFESLWASLTFEIPSGDAKD